MSGHPLRAPSGRRAEAPHSALSRARDVSPFLTRERDRLVAAAAVGVPGIAIATLLVLGPLEHLPGVPFFFAIAGTAWFGRFVPALVVTAFSAACYAWLAFGRDDSFEIADNDLVSLLGFLLLGAGVAAAVAWQRAGSSREEGVRERLRLQAEITDILQQGASSPGEHRSDSTEALQRLTEHVVPRFADWCVIHLVEGDDLVPVALAHSDPAMTKLGWQLQEQYPARIEDNQVLQHGSAMFVPELTDEMLVAAARDEEHLSVLRRLGLRSAIGAPLHGRGTTFGVLTLVLTDGPWRYEEADLEFAIELAGRAAVAVDTIRAFEEATDANQRAGVLQSLAASLSSMSSVDEVLDAVVRDGVEAVGASAGLVALLDGTGSQLEVQAQLGYRAEAIDAWSRFPVAAALPMSEAVRDRRPVVVANLEERDRRYPIFANLRQDVDHSLVCLPIVAGDEVIGGVSLSYPSVREFSDDDLDFLSSIVNQAGQALKRASLFEERDRTATLLQANLLPRSLPELEGLRIAAGYWSAHQATDVGGDFYDVVRTPSGGLAMIGDVCGRGAEAASLMGLTRHTAHALAEREDDPVGLVRRVNDILLEHIDDGRFVTLAVVALRPAVEGGLRVSVVCAGHPPPLLFRSGEIGPAGEYGMPLGLSKNAAFTATELTLEPGQGLLLYTDGISERHRTHVDATEDAELMAVLRDVASASAQGVVNALGDLLVAAGPLHDDAAVLVIAPE